MGVGFCLLFLLWFTSGAILMYWDFPSVSAADRLTREPQLDASRILVSPGKAYDQLRINELPDRIWLSTYDGRPVYRFVVGEDQWMVYADNGQEQSEFPPDITLRIAAAWTGQPPGFAKVEENTEEDQWTVEGQFQDLRPIRKYSWPDGEQVYVSTVTGDVVQYTTRASRMGAYFGAIPHWLYFTPLRKHGQQWSRLVIWASGFATVTAILGIAIGIWMFSPSRRFRNGAVFSSIPYTGQKRWHLILGLIFGPLACTWAFSGMLSMDPFPQLQSGNSDRTEARLRDGLRGSTFPLAAFDAKLPSEAIRQAGSNLEVKELELIGFAGEPYYLATESPRHTLLIPIRGAPIPEFDRTKIVEILKTAVQPAELEQIRQVTEYESYYLDRQNRLPLPVLFVRLNDDARSMYYVDPKTARIVRSYNGHSRWNRWLYHGLHSVDLPWLYKHRPAWDIAVLVLLAGGSALSVTSLLLAWRVLSRKISAVLAGAGGMD
jgi:hypothetical protein